MALALLLPGAGLAQDNNNNTVTLRIVPDRISLQSGLAKRTIVLIAQVPAAATIQQPELQLLPSAGLTAVIQSAPPQPATGDLAWTIEIAADGRPAKDSHVLFRLNYRVPTGTEGRTRSIVTATTLAVAYEPPVPGQSFKATLQPAFETLKAGQKALAILIVENPGVEDATLDKIEPLSPLPTTVVPRDPLPQKIPGRSLLALPLDVTPDGRVVQGNATLLLRLTLTHPPDPTKTVVDASARIALGIPGLSEINTLLQIPSLFFLPGVLIVLTCGLLWRYLPLMFSAPDKPAEFPYSARSGEFYLLSITVSLIASFIYTLLTGRDTERVSPGDLALLWFASVFFGSLGYLATYKCVSRRRKEAADLAAAERLQNNPDPANLAQDVLEKLKRHELSFRRECFSVTRDGQEKLVFKLGFGEAPDGFSWVAPRIVVSPTPDATPDATSETRKTIDETLATGDAARLVAALTAAGAAYRAQWQAGAPFDRPAKIADTDLSQSQGVQSLVRLI